MENIISVLSIKLNSCSFKTTNDFTMCNEKSLENELILMDFGWDYELHFDMRINIHGQLDVYIIV